MPPSQRASGCIFLLLLYIVCDPRRESARTLVSCRTGVPADSFRKSWVHVALRPGSVSTQDQSISADAGQEKQPTFVSVISICSLSLYTGARLHPITQEIKQTDFPGESPEQESLPGSRLEPELPELEVRFQTQEGGNIKVARS